MEINMNYGDKSLFLFFLRFYLNYSRKVVCFFRILVQFYLDVGF